MRRFDGFIVYENMNFGGTIGTGGGAVETRQLVVARAILAMNGTIKFLNCRLAGATRLL